MLESIKSLLSHLTVFRMQVIRKQYRRRMGRSIRFFHIISFNEKMQWLKLYYRNYRMVLCADKLLAKKYLSKRGYGDRVPKTLAVYKSPRAIRLEDLPDQFVLKTTHGSGYVVICKDKKNFDLYKAQKKLDEWMQFRYGSVTQEWFYDVLKPRIFAEEFLPGLDDRQLPDYKFMCFNGKCKLIFTVSERELHHHMKVDFYDAEWNHLPIRRMYPNTKDGLPKPECFDEMIRIAENLATEFPFVRVDFYQVNGTVHIGELTFFPGSGWEPFDNYEDDVFYGNCLKLPSLKERVQKAREYCAWLKKVKEKGLYRADTEQ